PGLQSRSRVRLDESGWAGWFERVGARAEGLRGRAKGRSHPCCTGIMDPLDRPREQRSALLSIGQLAELSSVPITTLRFYEKRGLIDPPLRENGQRRYEPSVVMRLMVIQFCQVAGLKLDEILVVLGDASEGRRATKEIAASRIVAIDEQVEQLALARLMMESAIRCRCSSVESCSCGAMDESVARLLAHLQRRGG
ncbi:MAG: MerR family transcriptional regulator, partial [Acidimicrobiales bacterium]